MNFDQLDAAIRTNKDDNDELATLYLLLNDAKREIDRLKSVILRHLETNLRAANRRHGECETATYGFTDPAPRTKVDEQAWKAAVKASAELENLQFEYEKARGAFLTDATQDARPYIHRKRGA